MPEPKITFSFGTPSIVGTKYTLPVLASSDTNGVELFGINLRFAYESAKFTNNVVVKNFQGGWGIPQGQPPVFTGNDASKIILGFTSAPRFVNGVTQLTNSTAPKIALSGTPSHLYDIELTINAGVDVSCPSIVWEKMKDPALGGFLGGPASGSEGITATKVKALVGSNYTTEPTTEYGTHKNWEYVGTGQKGKYPYGRQLPC